MPKSGNEVKQMRTRARGGRPRKLGKAEEEQVYKMYLEGIPITNIAYLNNVSVSTISRIIKRKQSERSNLHDRRDSKI